MTILETQSFTEAAERLFSTQSTLSKQIAALEKSVGHVLLQRTTRAIKPTRAGQIMRKYAERIVEQWDAANTELSELSEPSKKQICAGYMVNEQLAILLDGFRTAEWQRLGVDFSVKKVQAGKLETLLLGGEIDCAVVHSGVIRSHENIYTNCIEPAEIRAMISKKNPLASKSSLTIADLCSLTEIRCKRSVDPDFFDSLDRLFTEAGFSPPKRIETDDYGEAEMVSIKPNSFCVIASNYAPWEECVMLPVENFAIESDFVFVRRFEDVNPCLDVLYQTIRDAVQGHSHAV